MPSNDVENESLNEKRAGSYERVKLAVELRIEKKKCEANIRRYGINVYDTSWKESMMEMTNFQQQVTISYKGVFEYHSGEKKWMLIAAGSRKIEKKMSTRRHQKMRTNEMHVNSYKRKKWPTKLIRWFTTKKV